MTSLPDGIEIRGESASGFDQILTSDALALVAKLQRELEKRRIECLKRRETQSRGGAMARAEAHGRGDHDEEGIRDSGFGIRVFAST